MGALDSILSWTHLGQSSAGATQPPPQFHPGLLEAAMGLLSNRSTGGLAGLMSKFESAGLGPQFASWVGNGPNQPVSADQVQNALGRDQIAQLAQKFGLPTGQVASHLAQLLPGLVDHVTPDGQLPQNHGMVESALSTLKQKVFGT